jgi:hypothetical protein
MADVEQISIAQKYNLVPNANRDLEFDDEDDELFDASDYRAFSSSPQPMRREEMLNLLFKSGVHRSFSYSHLYSGVFDPEFGIALLYSDHIVNIRGLRLTKGYHRILARRLVQVMEACAPSARLVKAPDPVVTSIHIHFVTPASLEKFGFRMAGDDA